MKTKMLKRRILILWVLLFLIFFVIANKDSIILEHVTNPPPTLGSLESGLKTTNEKLSKLNSEFQDMKNKANAQSADAASAKAALANIH